MHHTEHPHSSHTHVIWATTKHFSIYLPFCLIFNSPCKTPHTPKVKSTLFPFILDHSLVKSLRLSLVRQVDFSNYIKNLAFTIISRNTMFIRQVSVKTIFSSYHKDATCCTGSLSSCTQGHIFQDHGMNQHWLAISSCNITTIWLDFLRSPLK